MIEINLHKIEEKGTKKEWKTVTRGGTTFKQRFRTGKKEKPTTKNITMSLVSDIIPEGMDKMDFMTSLGWDFENSKLFNSYIPLEARVCIEDGKAVSLNDTYMSYKNTMNIELLEVNPTQRRQGKGVETMKELVSYALSQDVELIKLNSMDADSDKFYDALGMEKIGQILMTSYRGDKEWMQQFVNTK